MNYQMLKTLLDSLISNFKCPNCWSWINENSLEIVWAAWTSINLDVMCNNCQKHTFVKAEVSQINLWNIPNINPENIEEIKQKLQERLSNIKIKKSNIWETKNIQAQINENDILELRETFKNEHLNVEDFLGNN